MKNSKKLVSRILAVVLAAAAILSVAIAASATEQNVYNDSGPDLELKEALISTGKQGSQYTDGVDYTATASFTQGNGTYSMTTNTFTIWKRADDCAYMYREYDIGNKATDKLTVTVDLVDLRGTTNGKHEKASAGIMIRDDINPDAATLFFHSRSVGIYNITRTERGEEARDVSVSLKESYPIKLKVEKVGNKYSTFYMLNGTDTWIPHSVRYLNLTGSICVGVTAHAHDKDRPVYAEFQNLSIVGEGTPDASEDGEGSGGSNDSPVVGEGIPWEDAPYDESTTLLYETFTDGSMTLGDAAWNNPIWDTKNTKIILTEDGDRKWYRDSSVVAYDYIGDPTWTDYTTSVEVGFDQTTPEAQVDGEFILYTRHSVVHSLGHTAYGVRMYADTVNGKTTYYMALVKRMRNSETDETRAATHRVTMETKEIENFFGNGAHSIKVRTFDNRITVWYDGVQMFDYYDMGATYDRDGLGAFVASKGNLGFYSKDWGVTVDNILVTKLEDPHGGDYDNSISANWDEDIPDYVWEYNNPDAAASTSGSNP